MTNFKKIPHSARSQAERSCETRRSFRSQYAEQSRVHTHFEYRTGRDIDNQVEDLNLEFKDMVECEKNGTFYRNPGACSILECPYRPKCLENKPDTDVLFVKKAARNEELL